MKNQRPRSAALAASHLSRPWLPQVVLLLPLLLLLLGLTGWIVPQALGGLWAELGYSTQRGLAGVPTP